MMLDFGPSQRALASFNQGPAWDLMEKVKRIPHYDPVTKPAGIIDLSGALNALMDDWMEEYYISLPPLHVKTIVKYGPLYGSNQLLSAAAGFFNRFFNPSSPVLPSQVLAGTGVTSLIDLIAWTICDKGDGILYPTPNFYMLETDLTTRASVTAIPVSTSGVQDSDDESGIKQLTPKTLYALAKWCARRGMHLVADEIYALSTFDHDESSGMQNFCSVLSIPSDGVLKDNVHCLYGMSKDFNMGGMRMGFLVTRNAEIFNAATRATWFTWVTAFSDSFIARFLGNLELVESYRVLYQRRLAEQYATTVTALKSNGIPYQRARAGLFVFIDLSKWLVHFDTDGSPESGHDTPELRLCSWLIDHGVFLNAGQFAGSDSPGHFRLVFTEFPNATVLAIIRIRKALEALEGNKFH
ncbi:1-aminocyclopropane-1-carboxylate synthase [Fusarium mundagurra]|uniref:1-aminocyclopropane-1-carboxylate synthase n=1 Tax=Fusarium mundagurra TaxID=1567541 RepID=A0A8H5YH10_9HYPO|nr:1-aminocyclopropane-1-carboxylate synthase [Fusarium mundagurra]